MFYEFRLHIFYDDLTTRFIPARFLMYFKSQQYSTGKNPVEMFFIATLYHAFYDLTITFKLVLVPFETLQSLKIKLKRLV